VTKSPKTPIPIPFPSLPLP
jgi:hypothetical protein